MNDEQLLMAEKMVRGIARGLAYGSLGTKHEIEQGLTDIVNRLTDLSKDIRAFRLKHFPPPTTTVADNECGGVTANHEIQKE